MCLNIECFAYRVKSVAVMVPDELEKISKLKFSISINARTLHVALEILLQDNDEKLLAERSGT